MNKEIDDIDKKIMNILLFDADTTNREIAAKCKIALGTVNNRIKRMKELGIIKKKTIMVDYEKLGYQIEVLIALKIRKGGFNEVAKALASDKNVFLVMDITGDYDAEVLARFHTKRELDEFVKKLQQQPFIESTSTRLILNIYREIKDPLATLIRNLGKAKAYKVSIDVPSGIDPDTGEKANVFFEPDLIITMHDIKNGLESYKDKTVVADIGIKKV